MAFQGHLVMQCRLLQGRRNQVPPRHLLPVQVVEGGVFLRLQVHPLGPPWGWECRSQAPLKTDSVVLCPVLLLG